MRSSERRKEARERAVAAGVLSVGRKDWTYATTLELEVSIGDTSKEP